jgi:integrase
MTKYLSQTHSQTTLGHALERLLEHTAQRVRDGVRSLHTLRMQESHARWLRAFPLPAELGIGARLGDVTLAALTPPTLIVLLELWRKRGKLDGRPLPLPTVAKRKSTVSRALRLAVGRGELAAVPQMPEIGLPPTRPRIRVLKTYAELRVLLAALPPERADWVSVSVWSCQRPSDVNRMKWSEIDLRSTTPSMIIRSTKTRKPHGIRVKVPGPLVESLVARRARLAASGKPPAPSDPVVKDWSTRWTMLPLACARNGLPPMSPMDLRHTGFSWMVRRLGLTRAAQEWGGWSDFNTLSRYYAHALPHGLDLAADELASIATEGGAAPSS